MKRSQHPEQRHCRILRCAVFALALASLAGCASTRWAVPRRRPYNPLSAQSRALHSLHDATPTPRTLQTLRRNNLDELAKEESDEVVSSLQQIAASEPTADNVYTIAEVAYVQAMRKKDKEIDRAFDLYGTAVANAYFYLFDEHLNRGRNPYDPRFRRACDLYNNSLERTLRHLQSQDALRPGVTTTLETERQVFDIRIAARDSWHERNCDHLKFVSDFKVRELTNHYRKYGLGVPMIAVLKEQDRDAIADQFYPPGMSVPVTAFLRVVETRLDKQDPSRIRHQCILELHDPTTGSEVMVGSERVPLETDLTTPLAYSLENPAFKIANVPIRNLRDVAASNAVSGLYLLERFDPHKIPVVMVHGFWSTLVTWMEMFNDLRGSSEIRDHYQFWFYLYPTGPPFWYSAAHFREQLAQARQTLDPGHNSKALDQMVLVGHSMGGLISLLQTVESEGQFWELVSSEPIDRVVCDPSLRKALRGAFFFDANASVNRVITIATPHQGSNFSNSATQWLGRKLIHLPEELLRRRDLLIRQNPEFFPEDSLLTMTTAVESLSTSSPAWKYLANAPRAPWVRFHNIIGSLESSRVIGAVAGKGDGIVTVESARLPYAESEVTVPSEHRLVHRQPETIMEVRRILLQHLNEVRSRNPIALEELAKAME